MAMTNILKVVSTVLTRFKFEMVDAQQTIRPSSVGISEKEGPLLCRIRARPKNRACEGMWIAADRGICQVLAAASNRINFGHIVFCHRTFVHKSASVPACMICHVVASPQFLSQNDLNNRREMFC